MAFDLRAMETPVDAEIIERLADSINLWVIKGIVPGDFLRCVLENNLIGAVAHADAENIKDLAMIVCLVANYLPVGSWGSVAKVEAWQADHVMAGAN